MGWDGTTSAVVAMGLALACVMSDSQTLTPRFLLIVGGARYRPCGSYMGPALCWDC